MRAAPKTRCCSGAASIASAAGSTRRTWVTSTARPREDESGLRTPQAPSSTRRLQSRAKNDIAQHRERQLCILGLILARENHSSIEIRPQLAAAYRHDRALPAVADQNAGQGVQLGFAQCSLHRGSTDRWAYDAACSAGSG